MVAEPLAVAAEPATTLAVIAFIRGHAVMMRPKDAAESPEPRLLLVGEALIQRGAGVGDLL